MSANEINTDHWRDRALALGARLFVKQSLRLPLPWPWLRNAFAIIGWTLRRAEGVTITRIRLGGRWALAYAPVAPERRILWLHGGGFVMGSPWTHAGMLSHFAQAANALIIAPSYRRAPFNPFPAAYEDALVTTRAAFDHAPELGTLTLGGDSAGGNLALATLATLLGEGIRPGALLLASPAAILDPEREVPEADDVLFPLSILYRIASSYGAGADPKDPRLSPIYAEFPDAPRTLIQCARGEYLEGDSDQIADRLRAFGAEVRVEKAPRAPHVWHFMAGTSPAADEALARMAAFIDQ